MAVWPPHVSIYHSGSLSTESISDYGSLSHAEEKHPRATIDEMGWDGLPVLVGAFLLQNRTILSTVRVITRRAESGTFLDIRTGIRVTAAKTMRQKGNGQNDWNSWDRCHVTRKELGESHSNTIWRLRQGAALQVSVSLYYRGDTIGMNTLLKYIDS